MSRNGIKYRTIFLPGRQTEIIEGFSDQLIIRVGKACNFRCIFCNVAENESTLSLKSSIREILAITFYKIKYSNFFSKYIKITISGGEPSIFQKETIFIIKYFTTYFRNRGIQTSFDLQSNASNIDYKFAIRLAELGIVQSLISSHAHDPIIFEKIIGVKYAIMGPKFESGVQNLLNAGIPVTFNVILNKINKDHYLEHIIHLVKNYPTVSLYNIGYVQPHGMAQKNFSVLISQYSEVSKMYSTVIGYLKFHGKRVHSHLVGLPLCHMDDWGSSMEYMHNKSLIGYASSGQTLIQSINDDNKIHVTVCHNCSAKRVCSGIWKEYENIQELKPFAYKLYTVGSLIDEGDIKSLKKLYDGGKRQFFLIYSDEGLDELLYKTHLIQSWGYVWISIIFYSGKEIDHPEQFAGMNIQIYSHNIKLNTILGKVTAYNQSVSFQFRIQLDILFPSLKGWTISRILSMGRTKDIAVHLPKKAIKVKTFREKYIYFSL